MGDQLNRGIGALGRAEPGDARVLLVRSERMVEGRPYHRQRLHLVLTAMRRFAAELRDEGFEVDERTAATLAEGLAAHRDEHDPDEVVATEPNSPQVRALLDRLEVAQEPSDQFLTGPEEFAAWARGRTRLRMEDFYRWQRRRLDYLMDGDEPAGGRWNFDSENREPPPDGDPPWPAPTRVEHDDLDREVLASLPDHAIGDDPDGWWPTSRSQALARLAHVVTEVLPHFGPHEDAMLTDDWHLAHSLLSPALNLGLLLPGEVCDRVEAAYRAGDVPIASAEGFIRQVIGWREYVWGLFWLWPDQAERNALRAHHDLPPAFTFDADTEMACLRTTLTGLHERGWVHHIQRLMVLSNLATLLGLEPTAVRDWMRTVYVDGADWVMGPNVLGMGLWADTRMTTKPYVSGGSYLDRMSDYCGGCRFDPKARTGEGACPFTSLYWDFLARHRRLLESNHRMGRQYATMDRLTDLPETRQRAAEVIDALARGEL